MSNDLFYLTLSAGLCIILWLPYIISRTVKWGLLDAVGYPENPKELHKWARRSQRAHLNLVENLPAFGALVLVAHVAGAANSLTAMGAALFFWSRLVQVSAHIMRIPWIRTLAFIVGWVGMVMIFVRILQHSAT